MNIFDKASRITAALNARKPTNMKENTDAVLMKCTCLSILNLETEYKETKTFLNETKRFPPYTVAKHKLSQIINMIMALRNMNALGFDVTTEQEKLGVAARRNHVDFNKAQEICNQKSTKRIQEAAQEILNYEAAKETPA